MAIFRLYIMGSLFPLIYRGNAEHSSITSKLSIKILNNILRLEHRLCFLIHYLQARRLHLSRRVTFELFLVAALGSSFGVKKLDFSSYAVIYLIILNGVTT